MAQRASIVYLFASNLSCMSYLPVNNTPLLLLVKMSRPLLSYTESAHTSVPLCAFAISRASFDLPAPVIPLMTIT